jgi:succinate dehydrogenase hydrophobic anchor subunit
MGSMRETKLWVWHMLAGGAILVLGGLHMVIMHMDGLLGFFNPASETAVDWANVVHRAQQVFFAVTYVLLLIITLFHGFYGLRNILLETVWGARHRGGITGTLWVLGILLFGYGTYAAIAAMSIA